MSEYPGSTNDPGDDGTEARPGDAVARTAGLRARLPDLLVEAVFIVLAVFAALAADEWRERKGREDLAERALQGIVHEIRANRQELVRNEEPNRKRLERLTEDLRRMREGAEPDELSIDYKVALTSTAAWEAARMSQAVHYMSLDLVTELAELYEIQALFERAQDDLVDGMTAIGARAREAPLAAAEEAAARIGTVVGYRGILVQAYDRMLADLE